MIVRYYVTDILEQLCWSLQKTQMAEISAEELQILSDEVYQALDSIPLSSSNYSSAIAKFSKTEQITHYTREMSASERVRWAEFITNWAHANIPVEKQQEALRTFIQRFGSVPKPKRTRIIEFASDDDL